MPEERVDLKLMLVDYGNLIAIYHEISLRGQVYGGEKLAIVLLETILHCITVRAGANVTTNGHRVVFVDVVHIHDY